ncbi:MAG TPA: DUF2059 domain-containing protein [Acidobacteriaceae bacterium]
MRIVWISITPLLLAVAAYGQAAKPSTPATHSPTSPAASTTTAAEPAPPLHPITDTQVHELMVLTGTDKIKQQLTENVLRYFHQAAPPFMPKDVVDDLTASLDKADINTPVVATYKKYLSTEDATRVIEFYRTPSGRALVKATPLILGEAQRTAMQTGQQVMRDVVERHRPEIEAAQKTYQAQHAAPTSGGALGPTIAPTPGAPASGPSPSGSTPSGAGSSPSGTGPNGGTSTPAPVKPATPPTH